MPIVESGVYWGAAWAGRALTKGAAAPGRPLLMPMIMASTGSDWPSSRSILSPSQLRPWQRTE